MRTVTLFNEERHNDDRDSDAGDGSYARRKRYPHRADIAARLAACESSHLRTISAPVYGYCPLPGRPATGYVRSPDAFRLGMTLRYAAVPLTAVAFACFSAALFVTLAARRFVCASWVVGGVFQQRAGLGIDADFTQDASGFDVERIA